MICELEKITVHYKTFGAGKPILLLHGFSPDHRLMAGCMEPVFQDKESWQRIYIDLPGMGKTKGEDWLKGSDEMLEVLLKFIDKVIPDQHFLLAGESYGGYLARGILSKRFNWVDGIAFICPMILPNHFERKLPPHTVIYRDETFLSTLGEDECNEFTSIAIVQDQYNWERFQDEIMSGVEVADHSFLQKIKRQYSFSFDVDKVLTPYDKPVLFMLGRQDSYTGYRDAWSILEHYPRATFAVLDRAGHNLQIEQRDLFNALVNEWLDRVTHE